jgi:hypothetical protein
MGAASLQKLDFGKTVGQGVSIGEKCGGEDSKAV